MRGKAEEKEKASMKEERKTTASVLILLVGFNLLLFAISPIIDPSLRMQLQLMQIALPFLALFSVIAAEVKKRL